MLKFQRSFTDGHFLVFDQKQHFDYFAVEQIHSDIIIDCRDLSRPPLQHLKKADGLVCFNSSSVMLSKTADCLPVVVVGEKGHALIHSGWRGLAQNIFAHPLLKKIFPKWAYIGPAISEKNYCVQNDFKKHFPTSLSFSHENGQLYFNLKQEAKTQLHELYPAIEVTTEEVCTYDDHRFFSYRRGDTKQRNWNIWIPEQVSDRLLDEILK